MKIQFTPRSLSRQTQAFLYLLALTFLAFLLAAASVFAAEPGCVEIVPYRQIGDLKLGDPLPREIEGEAVVPEPGHDSRIPDWKLAGKHYRLRTDKNGRIDYLQFKLVTPGDCVRIGKTTFTAGNEVKGLREKFPDCRYEKGLPIDALKCEGMQIFTEIRMAKEGRAAALGLTNLILRVDVDSDSPAEEDARRARDLAPRELFRVWPKALPFPYGNH
jgi:hypothetical protein